MIKYNLLNSRNKRGLSPFVSKLEDGTFEVRIPVPDNLKGKELVAYYTSSDGKTEEYKVEVKDGYAIFKTKHFSIYTLAESEVENGNNNENNGNTEINDNNNENTETNNTSNSKSSKTGDNILVFVGMLIIAIIGIVVTSVLKKKNKVK